MDKVYVVHCFYGDNGSTIIGVFKDTESADEGVQAFGKKMKKIKAKERYSFNVSEFVLGEVNVP